MDNEGKATEVDADISDGENGVSDLEFKTDSLSYYVVSGEKKATTVAEAKANGKDVTHQSFGIWYNVTTTVKFELDVRDLVGSYYVRLGCNYYGNYLQGILMLDTNTFSLE